MVTMLKKIHQTFGYGDNMLILVRVSTQVCSVDGNIRYLIGYHCVINTGEHFCVDSLW